MHRVVSQGEREKLVEHRAGVLGPRVGHSTLALEEPLHPPRGDLSERVVLEERPNMQSQVVAVVVLGVLGDVSKLQLGQPQLDEVTEGAGQAQQPPGALSRSREQLLLEDRVGSALRYCRRGDPAKLTVGVAEARDRAVAPTPRLMRRICPKVPSPCGPVRGSWISL